MSEQMILVDEHDKEIGQAEKNITHKDGLLHRAFSIFVFRALCENEHEVLLQQRQTSKYHCGGLWSNTCCGHPRVGEATIVAGERRLQEEMGFQIALRETGSFHYAVQLNDGMIENEIDHVLVGDYNNEQININPDEVSAYRWIKVSSLRDDLLNNEDKYTPWLARAFSLTGHVK